MSLSIYIHWPFCKKKCPYCDFNSHVRADVDHQAWAKALCTDIKKYAAQTKERNVVSVFFGGGTPSLMAPDTVKACLETIKEQWSVQEDIEVTLEANPTSSEAKKFTQFKAAGINRVSIGVQSFDDEALTFLGREHNSAEAIEAIKMARSIFDRVSFDLIYGRPQQALDEWQEELETAMSLNPDHISVYQLTIEKGTAFHTAYQRGDFLMPSDDLEADFYDLTNQVLEAHDLKRYEISNHARKGDECAHNLTYWQYNDYVGIGPGAHGRFVTKDNGRVGTREHKAPEVWLEKVQTKQNVEHDREIISKDMAFEEMLMMGLRLAEGLSIDDIEAKTGVCVNDRIPLKKMRQMIDEGYLVDDPERLQATDLGFKTLNSLLVYLLG